MLTYEGTKFVSMRLLQDMCPFSQQKKLIARFLCETGYGLPKIVR